MTHKLRVLLVVVAALPTLAFAQRGLAIVVSLEIHSRAPIYSGRADQARVTSVYGHVPVFFQGSAPRLIVRVTNYTSRRVVVGRAGRSWREDLDVRIEHTSQRSPAGRIVVRRAATKTALDAGAEDYVVYELTSEPIDSLPAGRYRMDATLGIAALPAAVRNLPGNRLRRQEEFDVRPIDGNRALWDLYLYRSMRARDAKDLPAARKWAEAVLRMHPNSFPANWDIANTWLRQNDCPKALPYLQRANTIIRTEADTLMHAQDYREIAGVAAALVKKCSPQAAR